MSASRLIFALAAACTACFAGSGQAGAAGPQPCALLTADDVAAVMGGQVTPVSEAGTPTESTVCSYGIGDLTVQLTLWGGRAEFDRLTGEFGSGLIPLSGVGDKVYENLHTGNGVQVYAVQGATSFQIDVQNGTGVASADDPIAKSGVALAGKVVDRIKSQ